MLVALVAPRCGATSYECPSIRAERELVWIAAAATMFRAEYGTLPSNENWLTELAFPSNAVINTRHTVYLEFASAGIDPWGNPYHYLAPGKRNPQSVDVWSDGADRQSMTKGDDPDDINNWNKKRPWLHASPYRWEPCNSWLVRNEDTLLVATLAAIALVVLMIWRSRKVP